MARVVVPVTEVSPPKATFTTSCTGSDNDLTFTGLRGGPGGNQVRVRYVDPAAASQSLTIVVEGTDISVLLATDSGSVITSTANLVLAALNARVDVSQQVTIALATSNDGTGVVTAFGFTALSGGALSVAQPSLTNGDATNDHYVTDNNGDIMLEVVSSDGAPQTVTFHYSPFLQPGIDISPHAETVAAGATREFGPFNPALFNQNADKDVYFDPSVSNTLDFRAYRVNRQS